jgi:hypothetical protein
MYFKIVDPSANDFVFPSFKGIAKVYISESDRIPDIEINSSAANFGSSLENKVGFVWVLARHGRLHT